MVAVEPLAASRQTQPIYPSALWGRTMSASPRPCAAVAFVVCLANFVFGGEPAPARPSVLGRYRVEATEREAFWTAAAQRASVQFQDGGMSVAMPDGSALWTFGDTFLGQGTNADGRPKLDGGVSSTACRVRATPQGPTVEYVNLAGKDRRADFLLPLDKSETWQRHRIWPLGGVHVDGTTYLYYTRVVVNDKEALGFEPDGAGLATAHGTATTFQRRLMPDARPPLPLEPACVLADGGDLYLYGIDRVGQLESRVILARVAAKEAHRPAAYRFWTGGENFSASKQDAATLVRDVWGQTSVAWNDYLKRYVMLHVGGVFHRPRTVYLRTSEKLLGPWSEPVQVFSLPGELGKHLEGLIYCAYLHPELFRDNGRVMPFTYCTLQKLGNPKLVEIELRE